MSLEKEKSLAENLTDELLSHENDISGGESVFSERELDVFISYSSLNKNVADAVVSDFEQHGIRCWYAPRDIMPGQEWVTAIHEAINAARLFILIYTDSSNESKQVANEVALAFNSGKTLIPFRLSDTEMSSELEYYLTRVHWLDAVKPPLMQSIENLRVYSEKILKGEVLKETRIKNANKYNNSDKQSKNAVQMPFWVLLSIIVLSVSLIMITIIILFRNDKNKPGSSDNIGSSDKIVAEADVDNKPLPTSVSKEDTIAYSPDSNAIKENNDKTADSDDEKTVPDEGKTVSDEGKTVSDEGKTVSGDDKNTSEEIYKKAYEIQMSDSTENKYELAYAEYMKTGDGDTTTLEIAEAMAELAGRYAREDGVELNYDKAIKLYEKAILSGSAGALNSMGILYQNGDGVEENISKAIEYYEKAAELQDVNAMINLGNIYQYGAENVDPDIEKALAYYKMASEKGDASAKSKYESLSASVFEPQKDFDSEEERLKYLESAYNAGNVKVLTAEDYYFLAYHYDSDPSDEDPDKVLKYALKGANAGSADCMIMLGDAYWYGKGVEPDFNQVLNWFGKALDSGIEGYNRKYCINGIKALVDAGYISLESAAAWIDD